MKKNVLLVERYDRSLKLIACIRFLAPSIKETMFTIQCKNMRRPNHEDTFLCHLLLSKNWGTKWCDGERSETSCLPKEMLKIQWFFCILTLVAILGTPVQVKPLGLSLSMATNQICIAPFFLADFWSRGKIILFVCWGDGRQDRGQLFTYYLEVRSHFVTCY